MQHHVYEGSSLVPKADKGQSISDLSLSLSSSSSTLQSIRTANIPLLLSPSSLPFKVFCRERSDIFFLLLRLLLLLLIELGVWGRIFCCFCRTHRLLLLLLLSFRWPNLLSLSLSFVLNVLESYSGSQLGWEEERQWEEEEEDDTALCLCLRVLFFFRLCNILHFFLLRRAGGSEKFLSCRAPVLSPC